METRMSGRPPLPAAAGASTGLDRRRPMEHVPPRLRRLGRVGGPTPAAP